MLLDAVDGDLGRGLTYSWLAQLYRADCYGGRAYHSDTMQRGIQVRAAAIAAHTGQHHGTVNKHLAWLREKELITTTYGRRSKTIIVAFNWTREQFANQLWLMREGYVDIPDRVRCAFDSLAVAVVAADAMHWMGVNSKKNVKTREKIERWRVFYKSERRWAKALHMPRTTVQECIDLLCADKILLAGGMRKNQGVYTINPSAVRRRFKATQEKFDEMCEARKKHPIDRTRVPQDLAGGFHRLSEFLSHHKGRGWVLPNRKMIYWLQTSESWDERARGVKN